MKQKCMNITIPDSVLEDYKKGFEENDHVTIISKRRNRKSKETTYKFTHDKVNFTRKVNATMIEKNRLLIIDPEYYSDFTRHAIFYLRIFEEFFFSKEVVAKIKSFKRQTVPQPTKKHSGIMYIQYDFVADAIENIKKHNLCKMTNLYELPGGFALEIFHKDIGKYKVIDILMDDNYSVLFEQKVSNTYGVEWMSYTNLEFCKMFRITLLTLEEFKKRGFAKAMKTENVESVALNLNAGIVINKETLTIKGFVTKEKSLSENTKIYKKRNIKVIIQGNAIIIKTPTRTISAHRLSDEQLKKILDGEDINNVKEKNCHS